MPLHDLNPCEPRGLDLSPGTVAAGVTGPVARLTTGLHTPTFSLLTGAGGLRIDPDGSVVLLGTSVAGDHHVFTARAQNGDGDAVERRFDLMVAAEDPVPGFGERLPVLTTPGASYRLIASTARLWGDADDPLAEAAGQVALGGGDESLQPGEIEVVRAGQDAVRITRWYDQSGNGNDLIAAAPAEQPALRDDVLIGGVPAMCFDGVRAGDPRGAQVRRLIGQLALSMSDATILVVIDPSVSVQQQYYWEARKADESGTALGHLQYPHDDFGGALPDHGGSATISNGAFRSTGHRIATVPQVMAFRLSAAASEVFVNGARVAELAAATTGTSGQLAVGGPAALVGIETYVPTWRCGAWIAIDKAVTDADLAAMTQVLCARFAVATQDEAVVINIGTSRVAGMSSSSATRTKAWFERAHYGARRIRTYNLGQDGKALSYAYADRLTYAAALYRPDVPVIYVIDDAINDLGGLGASSDPGAITATIQAFVTDLKALGANVRVVVATTLPQASGVYGSFGRSDAAVEADRVALNARIRAGDTGADAISDPAAEPQMGAYPAGPMDVALYPDRLHPSSAGYALVAGYNPASTLGLL